MGDCVYHWYFKGSFFFGRGGNLNLTMVVNEVWGSSSHLDPFYSYFINLLLESNLVDVLSYPMAPTSRNGMDGPFGASKILDRFLVLGSLSKIVYRFHSWTLISSISRHFKVDDCLTSRVWIFSNPLCILGGLKKIGHHFYLPGTHFKIKVDRYIYTNYKFNV